MKKALIAVAVYDTEENKRSVYTMDTYKSLIATTDPGLTQIIFINNNSCNETEIFLNGVAKVHANIDVIHLNENKGTAEAINLGWHKYSDIPYKVKLDNDVVFHDSKWIEKMIRTIDADHKIGILGLKRKDLPNSPDSEQYPTKLKFVSDMIGNTWDIVEECEDIIGTCHMFNPELLKKIGYLKQFGVYGFDDVLACARSRIAGFYNAFYPSIEIDHIDIQETQFWGWKQRHASLHINKVTQTINDMWDEKHPIYYNPFTS